MPAALWALYPPFTGSYRSAAVIHVYYCDNKERSWHARVEATPERQEEVVKELQALVESENPDLDSLLAEAKRISSSPGSSPQAE